MGLIRILALLVLLPLAWLASAVPHAAHHDHAPTAGQQHCHESSATPANIANPCCTDETHDSCKEGCCGCTHASTGAAALSAQPTLLVVTRDHGAAYSVGSLRTTIFPPPIRPPQA